MVAQAAQQGRGGKSCKACTFVVLLAVNWRERAEWSLAEDMMDAAGHNDGNTPYGNGGMRMAKRWKEEGRVENEKEEVRRRRKPSYV